MQPVYCDNTKKPVSFEECAEELWLVKKADLSEITEPSRAHAYILPDDTIWVVNYEGTGFVQINEKVTLYNTLGENEDGALTQKASRETLYADDTLNSVQIGKDATSTGTKSVAMGVKAEATGYTSVAIGGQTKAKNNSSVAVGYMARANNAEAIAIGVGSTSNTNQSIAIGGNSWAYDESSVALGYQSETSRKYSVSVGNDEKGIFRIIENAGNPEKDQDVATKKYVDELFAKISKMLEKEI